MCEFFLAPHLYFLHIDLKADICVLGVRSGRIDMVCCMGGVELKGRWDCIVMSMCGVGYSMMLARMLGGGWGKVVSMESIRTLDCSFKM